LNNDDPERNALNPLPSGLLMLWVRKFSHSYVLLRFFKELNWIVDIRLRLIGRRKEMDEVRLTAMVKKAG
jgi:hypothetical protein